MSDSSLQASASINPYASPAAHEPAPESVTDPQLAELSTFVGAKKAAYYLKQWRPLLSGASRSTKVNWTAFFFAGFWMAYRKMYWQAAVLYGVIIAITVIEFVLFDLAMGHEMPALADRAVSIGLAAICGVYANRWYLQHAQRQIADIRATVPTEGRRSEIARRGGTNFVFALGFNVLAMFVLVMVLTALGLFIGAVSPEAMGEPDVDFSSEF